ncbi:MAG: ABC transporter substrate-binding protein [Roseburia sp.]|nr:ABC transporter substrate-binding protein [Roseburia sp.]
MKKFTKGLIAVAMAATMAIGAGSLAACGNNDGELSGTVTVYMPSPAGLADKLAEGFTAKTGVKVEQFQGTTGEILARLEAEKANPQADVVILASWSDGLSLKEEDKLLSYQAKDADKMHTGMVDSDFMLYGSSASAVGVIYNTNKYSTLNADWSELADAKYKNDLAIPDPTKSGACKDFCAGIVTAFNNGTEIFDNLAANGMINGGANKAALDAVKQGSKNILVAGVDYNAYSDIKKGEHINIYYPASGTVINPRPAMIMKTAPHVDNAKAFIDYLLSEEAQNLVGDAYLLPGRSDITTTKRTNVSDIPTFNTDWSKMMGAATVTAQYVVNACKGNK